MRTSLDIYVLFTFDGETNFGKRCRLCEAFDLEILIVIYGMIKCSTNYHEQQDVKRVVEYESMQKGRCSVQVFNPE